MTATDDRQCIQDVMLSYAAAVDDNDMAAYRDTTVPKDFQKDGI